MLQETLIVVACLTSGVAVGMILGIILSIGFIKNNFNMFLKLFELLGGTKKEA